MCIRAIPNITFSMNAYILSIMVISTWCWRTLLINSWKTVIAIYWGQTSGKQTLVMLLCHLMRGSLLESSLLINPVFRIDQVGIPLASTWFLCTWIYLWFWKAMTGRKFVQIISFFFLFFFLLNWSLNTKYHVVLLLAEKWSMDRRLELVGPHVRVIL